MDITFKNGYTASLIDTGYGSNRGLYEIAVCHGGEIVYDTPITGDVLGFIPGDEVMSHLEAISALPERVE